MITQKQLILKWFEEHATLDRLQAFTELGIFELSARICDLKKEGHNFTRETKSKKNRYGKTFSYCEYRKID